MDPLFTATVDQEASRLRDKLDELWPMHAELLREQRSPWHDGAAFVVVDLLEHRGDPEALLLRLWAWDHTLIGRHL